MDIMTDELAKRAGVKVETLRFYERKRLRLMRGRWCEAALQPVLSGAIFGDVLDGSFRCRGLSWTSRSPT